MGIRPGSTGDDRPGGARVAQPGGGDLLIEVAAGQTPRIGDRSLGAPRRTRRETRDLEPDAGDAETPSGCEAKS
jgi:hypothetical protein